MILFCVVYLRTFDPCWINLINRRQYYIAKGALVLVMKGKGIIVLCKEEFTARLKRVQ